MINKVFLDLDGVLVDFDKAACEILAVPYPPSDWHWYKDILNGFEKVNDACDIIFWESLDWMPDGKEILKLVESFYPKKQIYLLSCPMPNSGSWTGKCLWVEREMPEYKDRLIITTVPKNNFVQKDVLLIDDKGENISEFCGAGGKTILIPRPWNSLRDVKDPMKQLKACLEHLA